MKRMLLSVLAIIFAPALFAQVQVGSAERPTAGRAGSLDDDDLAALRRSVTLFVVQYKDSARLDAFRKSIGDVWTITPFRVILPDSLKYLGGRRYSTFNFSLFTISSAANRQGSGVSSNVHLTYDLTIADVDKSGESAGRTILARFLLFAHSGTLSIFESRRLRYHETREEQQEKNSAELLRAGRIYSWGPVQIRGYLKTINDRLLSATRQGIMDDYVDRSSLAALATDTLYIPDYSKITYEKRTGEGTPLDENEAKTLVESAYPYPYRFVPVATLERMLAASTRPVYHLLYIHSNTDKVVSVVEARSGKIIYNQFVNLSYQLKSKDFAQLAGYVR